MPARRRTATVVALVWLAFLFLGITLLVGAGLSDAHAALQAVGRVDQRLGQAFSLSLFLYLASYACFLTALFSALTLARTASLAWRTVAAVVFALLPLLFLFL